MSDNAASGFFNLGLNPISGTYSYDANGNITADPYKRITSTIYNVFDKPTRINKSDGQYITFTYDGSGNMLTKSIFNASNVLLEKRDYIGNFEYVGGVLESVMHSEGRYRSATAKHEYHFKDHLGNTRLVYSDANNDGRITVNTEILQESHYYPFGLEFRGHYLQQSGYDYRYKFNDIERLKDLDVGIDMAFYRGMDPTTGRWMQVDPKAEAAGFGMSPYCAMGNNPVLYTDPNGDIIPILAAMAIGGIINMAVNHKQINSFQDGLVAFGIGAAAAGIGIATGGAAAGAIVGTGATTTALSSSAILTATMSAGAAGAGSEALIRTTGNALYFGKSSVGDAIGDGLKAGIRGLGEGLVFGAITGAMAINAGTYSRATRHSEIVTSTDENWIYAETGTNYISSYTYTNYRVPGANNAGSFSSSLKLYRGGNSTQARNFDVKINSEGFLNRRGISLNSNKMDPNVQKYGGAFEVDINSISKDLLIKHTKGSHYELVPRGNNMTLDTYQNLLKDVKLNQFNIR